MDYCGVCKNDGWNCRCEFRTIEGAIKELDRLRAENEKLMAEIDEIHATGGCSYSRLNEAEAKLKQVADNISGIPAYIVEWSEKVGEALLEFYRLQQGDFENKLKIVVEALEEIVELYREPLGCVIDGAEMGQKAKQALAKIGGDGE